MDLIFKNRNSKLSERQRNHIEQKLGKLERYLDHATSITVEVSTEQRRNQGDIHRLQVTLVGEHGIILRADQSAGELFTAVDMVQDVLQRQIMRYKDKHWRRGRLRRKGEEFVASDTEQVGDISVPSRDADETPRIMRVKKFALKPMFSDEAVEQMELLDHSFFVFRDADTSRISVVYRRKDGHYGLIVPDEI